MSDSADPLVQPGSVPPVLINKLGISDFQKLRKLEYAVANARLRELKDKPIQGNYDLDHLKAIHKHLLGDIYEWAGKTRDEVYNREIFFSKGPTLFALHSELKKDAKTVFESLAKENFLRGLENDKPAFVGRLTQYYASINKLHPFREGNGRSTQEFISQLAKEAGYTIDYKKVDKAKWNLAARESAAGRTGAMADVFKTIVSPSRAIAFDKLPPQEALAKHPELRNSYLVMKRAKDLAEKQFKAPTDQMRFFNMYRTRVSAELHQGNEIAAPERTQDRGRSR